MGKGACPKSLGPETVNLSKFFAELKRSNVY